VLCNNLCSKKLDGKPGVPTGTNSKQFYMRHVMNLGPTTNNSFSSKSFKGTPHFKWCTPSSRCRNSPLLKTLNFHYCVYNSLPLISILNHMNPIHTHLLFQFPYQTHYVKYKEHAHYPHWYWTTYFIFGAVSNSKCNNLSHSHTNGLV